MIMSRSPSVSDSHVKVKKNLEFLDALLADLQNTAGLSTSYTSPSVPVNGTAYVDVGASSGTPHLIQGAVSNSTLDQSVGESDGVQTTDFSELDDLLTGLNNGHDGLEQSTNGAPRTANENGETNDKGEVGKNVELQEFTGADAIFQQSTFLSSKVEALLDELDSAVTPAPQKQTMSKPVPMKANIADVTPIPRTASSATKELDDLMASLSDFKINPKQPPPVAAKPERPPTDMQSKTADYAKINKQPSLKGPAKQGQPKGNQLDSMLGNLQSDMSRQGVTMVTKGTCAACNKPIIGQVCTALGKAWHPEHFTCTVCEIALGTRTFFERDGKPYCETDYHEQFAPKCGYCDGPIFDSCVTAMDNTWHPEHFVCAQCGRQFGESGYHEKDGKPYCRDDYFNLFAPKCSGCNQAILDNYISALNGHWHPECFVCMECHQPFQGGSFFEHEGMPYCEMHYHARRGSLCYSCQKPITGRCITAMHRKFHPEHFICAFCLKQLNKGTFKEQNDKPYCHPCFVKLFG